MAIKVRFTYEVGDTVAIKCGAYEYSETGTLAQQVDEHTWKVYTGGQLRTMHSKAIFYCPTQLEIEKRAAEVMASRADPELRKKLGLPFQSQMDQHAAREWRALRHSRAS